MSVSGPLPDTPQTHLTAILEHLESALGFTRTLGAHVWSLLARIDALEAEVVSRGHTITALDRENARLRAELETAR
jgi:hypothetical protein